jgi:sec-independent protein translocase protein TatA
MQCREIVDQRPGRTGHQLLELVDALDPRRQGVSSEQVHSTFLGTIRSDRKAAIWSGYPLPAGAGGYRAREIELAPGRPVDYSGGKVPEEGKALGSFSLTHWLVVLLVVLILFGAGKLPRLMGDFAKGIKNFKTNLKDDEASETALAGSGSSDDRKPVESR